MNYVFVQHGIRAAKLRQMSIGDFLRTYTGVILIGGTNQANQCLVLAEIKGCQVRDWIVGK